MPSTHLGTSFAIGSQEIGMLYKGAHLLWVSNIPAKIILNAQDGYFNTLYLREQVGGFDCVIDWGDGETSIAPVDGGEFDHSYVLPGDYTVTISGNSFAGFHNNWGSKSKDIKELIHHGRWKIDTVETMDESFAGCEGLTKIHPGALDYVNVPNFRSVFDGCLVLESIPADLFKYSGNAETFKWAFYENALITSIPETLFAHCPNVLSFEECFFNCYELAAIPPNLFMNNPKATNFAFTFSDTSIASIPEDLFKNNVKATDFNGTFYDSYQLASIPPGILRYNVEAIYVSGIFQKCPLLTTIPDHLFDTNVNIEDMRGAFRDCPLITSVPTGFFDHNTALLNVSEMFSGCLALETIPPNLFANNPVLNTFNQTFWDCRKLNIRADIFGTDYANRFAGGVVDTAGMFERGTFTGTVAGLAPPIWLFERHWGSYGDLMFNGGGNTPTSISDYFDIPFEFRGMNVPGVKLAATLGDNTLHLRNETAGFDGVIWWGDGTSTVCPANGGNFIHNYAVAGDYDIWITGDYFAGFYVNNQAGKEKYKSLYHYGKFNATTAIDAFRGCSGLVEIWPEAFKGTAVSSFENAFYGCTAIEGGQFNTLFGHVGATALNFKQTFYGCTGLLGISADIFKLNTQVTTFYGCFSMCTGLNTIPTDAFRYNIKVTDFGYVFNNCTALLSLPVDTFRYNTLVTNFKGALRLSGINTLSATLFQYNTAATNFAEVFQMCYSLATIPTDLFRYNTAVTDFGWAFWNTPVVTIPADIFRYNTAVTTFQATFAYCQVATIPADLFTYNVLATNFIETFRECIKLVARSDMFGIAYGTRFLGRVANFTDFMNRTVFSGGSKGDAPPMWSFATGTLTLTNAFAGAGNSFASLSNYYWMPLNYGTTAEPAVITFAATVGDNTLHLRATANGFDGTINWGDGQTSSMPTGGGNVIHNYAAAGTYTITISGTKFAGFYVNNQAGSAKYISVVSSGYWGTGGPSSMSQSFYGCAYLTSVAATAFRGIPRVSFFIQAFHGCSGLATISADLFKYNTNVQSFGQVFRACPALTAIPADLFRYNVAVTNMQYAFQACTGLTSVPVDIFRYNILVTAFDYLFHTCTNLATFPADLFRYNTEVINFSCTFFATKIATIPANMFQYNTKVTNFLGVFQQCSMFTSLPVDLFRYNTLVTTFAYAFWNCMHTSFNVIPADIFRYNTAVTSFQETFAYAYYLTTIPADLFKYNVLATNFSQVFLNDTRITYRADVFGVDYATRFSGKTVNFTGCFKRDNWQGGSQGAAPAMWSFTGGTFTTAQCFAGIGNSATSLSNFASIPAAWIT